MRIFIWMCIHTLCHCQTSISFHSIRHIIKFIWLILSTITQNSDIALDTSEFCYLILFFTRYSSDAWQVWWEVWHEPRPTVTNILKSVDISQNKCRVARFYGSRCLKWRNMQIADGIKRRVDDEWTESRAWPCLVYRGRQKLSQPSL